MLNFLKKIFQKETPVQAIELRPEELADWLKKHISNLKFDDYLQKYSQQLKEIKSQLSEKAAALKEAQISKDYRNVEERIKNIVCGHRDHYTAEIERFAQNLSLTKEKISIISKNPKRSRAAGLYRDNPCEGILTLENGSQQSCEVSDLFSLNDCEEAILFNENLNQELEQLAKRTAKSYQAAQHLFFEPVEELFKLLGALNTLVNEFNSYIQEHKIAQLPEIEHLIAELNNDINKKKKMEEEIQIQETQLLKLQKEKEKKEQQLKKLNESKEYQEFLRLKHSLSEMEQQSRKVEYEVFSFFSKLDKALKKYRRVAVDDKLIKKYLENSVAAFWNDSELGIVPVLDEVKRSLTVGSIQFDEKQKKKFMELIERSRDYLQDFAKKGRKLRQEQEKLSREIEGNNIMEELEKHNQEITIFEHNIDRTKKDISELRSNWEKIYLEKINAELIRKIKEIFKKEIMLKY